MLLPNIFADYLLKAETTSPSRIVQAGVCSLAGSLKKNGTLLQLDLMGMSHLGKSEKVLRAFIDMYDANITLKKVIWRLDHPLAHTVARLVTRNNSIHRRKYQNKPYFDLLPDCMKKTDGSACHSSLGRAEEMVTAAAAVEEELKVAKEPRSSEQPKSAVVPDLIYDEPSPIADSVTCEELKSAAGPLALPAQLGTAADLEDPIVEVPAPISEQTTSVASESPVAGGCPFTVDVIAT